MAMKSRYPQFYAKREKNGNISFKGKLQVKPELPVYTVEIIYRGNSTPAIQILDPAPVKDAPHIYSDTQSLCLYHRDNFKWTASKLIANEIMGWTAGWIYFYEYWLQTKEWVGPEVPHGL
ncbi:hypothetical protein [Olivibacter sitiensis]|uniref:hypothetical protein n=1 Tax=Olivibacter sitiensis TaxID=376470 RepID=UPI0012FC201E|nr:hypothetical protein [Olivibacter sitiensis]